MARYLALQIHKGKLIYDEVILKFPELREEIDIEITILEA